MKQPFELVIRRLTQFRQILAEDTCGEAELDTLQEAYDYVAKTAGWTRVEVLGALLRRR